VVNARANVVALEKAKWVHEQIIGMDVGFKCLPG